MTEEKSEPTVFVVDDDQGWVDANLEEGIEGALRVDREVVRVGVVVVIVLDGVWIGFTQRDREGVDGFAGVVEGAGEVGEERGGLFGGDGP